jgi:hypothetical protein
MTEDILVNKDKFDAVLKRIANMKPKTLKEIVAAPKRNKDGNLRRQRTPKVSS